MSPRFLALAVLAAALACGALAWNMPGSERVRVDIPSGLRARDTAALLRREGVLRSALEFRILAKLTGKDRSLKPGEYLFRKPTPSFKVLNALYLGMTERIRVVIPEGFMAKQIADRLDASGVTDSADFMAYVDANNLEGFLFPTTYFFSKGMSAEKVAHHMHDEFDRQVAPHFAPVQSKRFTLGQVTTLASIVQREAAVVGEMPMIAAVYSNRLRDRMRLEADPTVQYALGRDTGRWEQNLRYKHLEVYSKYNTYVHFGLPPGPICSPGLDAVRAVLNPAKTDAIYFVADNTGHHAFSRTLEEHNRARDRAKKERRLRKLQSQ